VRIGSRLTGNSVVAGLSVLAIGTGTALAGLAAPPARAAVSDPVAVTVPVAAAARPAAALSSTPVRGIKHKTVKPGAAAPAGVHSRLAEVANAATGADLWSRSSVTMRPMGSITKVMTAYVVLTTPGLNLNRVITVPGGITAYDKKYDASTAGLHPGEELTTRQLLFAMMLPSGCDAAYTLATAYGPGLSEFVARMNLAAKLLGLTKTHFTDFSGLPAPTETSTYSTAHDLVALGRAAMRVKTLATVVSTRRYAITATSGHRAHSWKNTNPLLGKYPGATGIKTGYTLAAGQCLLFEAKRGSTTLVGVVLDSSPVDTATPSAAAADAKAMLNWAFSR
jgi:D-alanyl-D-alanine carboxypeptidase (penicillin-binding protein 5/6)